MDTIFEIHIDTQNVSKLPIGRVSSNKREFAFDNFTWRVAEKEHHAAWLHHEQESRSVFFHTWSGFFDAIKRLADSSPEWILIKICLTGSICFSELVIRSAESFAKGVDHLPDKSEDRWYRRIGC
ncbi:MAG: hypothetical protein ABIL58_05630 [Pseudomonadota bacterium]